MINHIITNLFHTIGCLPFGIRAETREVGIEGLKSDKSYLIMPFEKHKSQLGKLKYLKSVTIVLLGLFLTISHSSWSQNQRCLTEALLPSITLDEQEQRIQSWMQANPVLPRTIVTIPVVVHIVYHVGSPSENISDQQIQSQIEVLNRDFRGRSSQINEISAEFKPLVADVELEFCLASVDPRGRATTGITRTETTQRNIANNAFQIKDGLNKGIDAWDTNAYLNIWVGARADGVLGQATRPNEGSKDKQGLVIDYRAFGTIGTASDNKPYNQGRTAVHEVGHYFGLQHVWGDEDEPSCSTDDGIADTPRQNLTYANECPSRFDLETFSCGTRDMYMNFMNYTDDSCMAMFSLEQKKRMLAVLYEFRSGLLESNGCGMQVVSTHNPAAALMNVYPNPVTDELILQFTNLNQAYSLVLFNSLGHELFTQNGTTAPTTRLKVAHLPKGCYFLTVSSGSKTNTQKVIIQ
ncbi:MAG: T9SS type A sorting domain-containing protein [Saprospiraceae bacterium]|nr:T9SS type A sorting domain-containing protein [Saprospiraceae bacterium]